jgi:hypothetical protein
LDSTLLANRTPYRKITIEILSPNSIDQLFLVEASERFCLSPSLICVAISPVHFVKILFSFIGQNRLKVVAKSIKLMLASGAAGNVGFRSIS